MFLHFPGLYQKRPEDNSCEPSPLGPCPLAPGEHSDCVCFLSWDLVTKSWVSHMGRGLVNGWWRSYNDKEPQAGNGYLKSQAVKDCLSFQMLLGILRFSQGCQGRLWSHHMLMVRVPWFPHLCSGHVAVFCLVHTGNRHEVHCLRIQGWASQSHRRWPIHLLSAGLWWNVMIFTTW